MLWGADDAGSLVIVLFLIGISAGTETPVSWKPEVLGGSFMPKIYKEEDVYEAAIERYEYVFREFDNYYAAVSGGKDSSVMLQLMADVARRAGKKISVLYIDMEAQYQATIEHICELIECTRDVVENWYWIALPLSLRNAVSALQPKWICWDKEEEYRWVRPMPRNEHVINEDNYPKEWDWFRKGMEFEEFTLCFAKWFNDTHRGKTAAAIGIRSDESLNRFQTIINRNKEKYDGLPWTTRIRMNTHILDVWNFFPIYDWQVEDDWTAVSKLGLKFNYIYELMYKNGVSIHRQRLCQPYGDDQRNGLDQFRMLEPETWEKVLTRVEGVNFGNIYCRSSLLGNMKSEKPKDMTWEQYAVFLLESLGLYAPEVRDHYHEKILIFLRWYEKTAGLKPTDIPEEADKKLEAAKKIPSWRRIARAIEKNDFWMTRLSCGRSKKDVQRLYALKRKYRNIIHPQDTDNKALRLVAEQLEEMDGREGQH